MYTHSLFQYELSPISVGTNANEYNGFFCFERQRLTKNPHKILPPDTTNCNPELEASMNYLPDF